MSVKIVKVDYIEAGTHNTNSPKVILFHSSVAGAKQWRKLMAHVSEEFHTIAINMFGYGETPSWTTRNTQSFKDQALLATQFIEEGDDVIFIGHSFGGSVAMKAATLFSKNVKKLILIEPNPFYLLVQNDRLDGFENINNIKNIVQAHGEAGDWEKAAQQFSDYWNGEGSWKKTPSQQKLKFIHGLQQTHFEWDAIFNEETSLDQWVNSLTSSVDVILAKDTVFAIKELMSLLASSAPKWNFIEVEHGGHMIPLTRPDFINPIILNLLRDTK